MIAVLVLAVALVAGCVGLVLGVAVVGVRTEDALKLARYREAIALADDLVKTPDALDLRPRAQALLEKHRKSNREDS
jgi:hypothetical protein